MDIISAIDTTTGCQQCGKPLGASPSADYCSEWCQRTWTARRSVPLPIEPKGPGMAAHQCGSVACCIGIGRGVA
jgi:hypothetical protein